MTSKLATARSNSVVEDRKSTRLNSSHLRISYAVFCLKKKTKPAQGRRCTWRERLRSPSAPCTHRGSAVSPTCVPAAASPLPDHVHVTLFFFFKDRGAPEISPLCLPGPFPI